MRKYLNKRTILVLLLLFLVQTSYCDSFDLNQKEVIHDHYVNDINLRTKLAAINFFKLITESRQSDIQRLNLPNKLHFSEPLEMSPSDVELLLENTNWMIRLHCGGQPVPAEIIKNKGHFDGVHKPEMNFLFQDGKLFRSTPKVNSLDQQVVEKIDQSLLINDTTKYVVYYQHGSTNSYVIDYINNFFDEEIRIYQILETGEHVIEESLRADSYFCENGEPVRKLLVGSPMS